MVAWATRIVRKYLVSQGFTAMRSCQGFFYHVELDIYVVVYVDDFIYENGKNNALLDFSYHLPKFDSETNSVQSIIYDHYTLL